MVESVKKSSTKQTKACCSFQDLPELSDDCLDEPQRASFGGIMGDVFWEVTIS